MSNFPTSNLPMEPLMENGSGFPVLFIHGESFAYSSWNSLFDKICKHYRVIVPRLPFHSRPLTLQRRTDLISYINNFIYYNMLNSVILIASGTGAELALDFAGKYPEKILKLIVTCHFSDERITEDASQQHNLPSFVDQDSLFEFSNRYHPEDVVLKNLFFKSYHFHFPALLLLRHQAFLSTIPEFEYRNYSTSPATHPNDFLEPIKDFLK
jgi:pimeloyl-ACP methyl ester carboxylesterase